MVDGLVAYRGWEPRRPNVVANDSTATDDEDKSGFFADGCERTHSAAEPEIRSQVEREYAERLSSASPAERRALYDLAIQTGLRSNEIRSLRRSSLVLDGEYPYVSVAGRTTKNKTPSRQYIGNTLADELRTMVACKTAKAALFNLPPKYDMAKMLRDDLAAGRKAWLNEAKRDPEERIKREGSDFLEATNESALLLGIGILCVAGYRRDSLV